MTNTHEFFLALSIAGVLFAVLGFLSTFKKPAAAGMDERECYEKLYGDLVNRVPHYEDFYLKRCIRAGRLANELLEKLTWQARK